MISEVIRQNEEAKPLSFLWLIFLESGRFFNLLHLHRIHYHINKNFVLQRYENFRNFLTLF